METCLKPLNNTALPKHFDILKILWFSCTARLPETEINRPNVGLPA